MIFIGFFHLDSEERSTHCRNDKQNEDITTVYIRPRKTQKKKVGLFIKPTGLRHRRSEISLNFAASMRKREAFINNAFSKYPHLSCFSRLKCPWAPEQLQLIINVLKLCYIEATIVSKK